MLAGHMMRKVELVINGKTIPNKPFVDDFIAGVVEGLISSCEKGSPHKNTLVRIEKEDLVVKVDDLVLQTGKQVSRIIKQVLVGLARPLGVTETVASLKIEVNRC